MEQETTTKEKKVKTLGHSLLADWEALNSSQESASQPSTLSLVISIGLYMFLGLETLKKKTIHFSISLK